MHVKTSASLMCMNLLHIGSEVRTLSKYIDEFHIDILDWHYCKNMSLSPVFMGAIQKVSNTPMEAHLYVDNIDMKLIDTCIDNGASIITMPPEIIEKRLFQIKRYLEKKRVQFGIFLNPSIPVETIVPYGYLIDRLLILSVDPGFAGQPFIPTTFKRIQKAAQLRETYQWHYQIEIDGCCNEKYYKKLYASGADIFILGSSGLFSKSKDTNAAVQICLQNVERETKNEMVRIGQ